MEEWKEYKLEEVCSRLRSGKGIKSDYDVEPAETFKNPVILLKESEVVAASSHPTPATVAHRSHKPQETTQPQAERINGAEAIVRSLENLGTDLVFGLPGGAVLPLYEALY